MCNDYGDSDHEADDESDHKAQRKLLTALGRMVSHVLGPAPIMTEPVPFVVSQVRTVPTVSREVVRHGRHSVDAYQQAIPIHPFPSVQSKLKNSI